jgi:hypothetical protein
VVKLHYKFEPCTLEIGGFACFFFGRHLAAEVGLNKEGKKFVTKKSHPFMQELPVLPEETIAATRVSARRAREYVAQADRERSRTWDADLRRIEEEWQGAGSESLGGTWCAANELTREYAQRQARNGTPLLTLQFYFLISLLFR